MKRLTLAFMFMLGVSSLASAQGSASVTLEGQVVCCEECWAKADRKTTAYGTRADLEQAVECVASGDPTLLAVANNEGGFTMYQLEAGKFKRPGKSWIEYVGQRLAVTGSAGKRKNQRFIKVDTLSVLAPAIAASEQVINVIGTEAELVLKDLYGVEQRLTAYRGRIVVLNFWATYCVPCRKEMPDLAAIQNHYAALGVQVIGAAADPLEEKQKVLQFVKDTKINFPVWLGASAGDMQRVGLSSTLPGTIVIGRDGKIVATLKGVIKPAELKKHIDALLAAAEKEASRDVVATNKKTSQAASVPS